jgi:cupin superfamily acireductone dioxygenase involved in methionine salvage
LVLTHFGAVNEVQKHLDDLATMLNNWANWMLPQYQAGKKQEEIIPLFEQYVANLLKENGVKEIDIPKYQSANPAFMSVAGLMRYWHKRLNVAS